MRQLRVVGLGRGDKEALELLKKLEPGAAAVISPSSPGFLVNFLKDAGMRLINIEEELSRPAGDLSLEALSREAARVIIEKWKKDPRAVLVLPGKPENGCGLLQALGEEAALDKGFSLEILPGQDIRVKLMDFLDKNSPGTGGGRDPGTGGGTSGTSGTAGTAGTVGTAGTGFSGGLSLVDGYQLEQVKNALPGDLVITGIYSTVMLPKIQDWLLKWYPPDHQVHFLQFEVSGNLSRVYSSSLMSLNEAAGHVKGWMNLHLSPPRLYSLGDMITVMEQLRAPDGCPWDRQQDHKSLKPYLIEEAYEVVAAIEGGNAAELCEELGDLLLQVIFHSCLAGEQGDFSLWDVIDGITRKIYRRHPHVFSGKKAGTVHDVSLNWQEIKQEEKKEKQGKQGKQGKQEQQGKQEKQKEQGRFSMPEEFPALMKAQKVQKRAADVGFDWPDISGAFEKLQEEIEELKSACYRGTLENVEEEMGDLFFALVNIARFLGVDSELVLHHTVEKFKRRFQYIEEQVQIRGGDYSCFTLKELDYWWEEAKTREKK